MEATARSSIIYCFLNGDCPERYVGWAEGLQYI